MFCVVTTRATESGRFYRLPTEADRTAFGAAAVDLEQREKQDGTERSQKGQRNAESLGESKGNRRSLVPDEAISHEGTFRIIKPLIYGMDRWGDLFSPRQALALTTLARLVREAGEKMRRGSAAGDRPVDAGLAEAVQTCLGLVIGRQADAVSSFCRWSPNGEFQAGTFARQAIGMMWDFSEVSPFALAGGGWDGALEWVACVLSKESLAKNSSGHVEQASATNHTHPDDAAMAFVTDPPYYDSVAYAYLSDFFYVWMCRSLADVHPALFRESAVPKDAEIIVDMPHKLNTRNKDVAFYEREMTKAFAEGRRVLAPSGVGTIVFASKTTASWEAILKAVIDAGFIITGSWPIDTERESRVAAQGQARLASSVHLVCRPREHPDGSLRTEVIGDWRDVLHELPHRIHEWMPRLAEEGVVGADAIFSCLGPALEIFSRHSRVEKANGDPITLREYLEHVWAAISREALSLVFRDADATGLEPDARLTAMWLWTLSTGSSAANGDASSDEYEDTEDEEDEELIAGSARGDGFSLEFDAARKIAQGLGAHLEDLRSVIEVKGKLARLLPVSERSRHLFGKDNGRVSTAPRKPKKAKTAFLPGMADAHGSGDAGSGSLEDIGPLTLGVTVLDRIHQAMLLFGSGRSDALKRFLVEEGAGNETRFWKLAQSLSALYPPGTEEKRWVDGVLARKKGLGF